MIRFWLLLFTLLAASPWWCTGEDAAVDSMPDGATPEEREALRIALENAEKATRRTAKKLGRGPLVTQKMVEAAQIKARNEAHDRYHARLLDEQRNGPAELEELVPVQALLPAKLVLGQNAAQEANNRER